MCRPLLQRPIASQKASDLRLILSIVKAIRDLERIGDQAERIARMAIRLAEMERPKNQYIEISSLGEHVLKMLHNTLDAFARMDVDAAFEVAKEDKKVDIEYDAVMRQSLTYMMEDTRNITRMLDVMWSARAIERIGDHSKNICEYVIYLVKGKDVRHVNLEKLEQELQGDLKK